MPLSRVQDLQVGDFVVLSKLPALRTLRLDHYVASSSALLSFIPQVRTLHICAPDLAGYHPYLENLTVTADNFPVVSMHGYEYEGMVTAFCPSVTTLRLKSPICTAHLMSFPKLACFEVGTLLAGNPYTPYLSGLTRLVLSAEFYRPSIPLSWLTLPLQSLAVDRGPRGMTDLFLTSWTSLTSLEWVNADTDVLLHVRFLPNLQILTLAGSVNTQHLELLNFCPALTTVRLLRASSNTRSNFAFPLGRWSAQCHLIFDMPDTLPPPDLLQCQRLSHLCCIYTSMLQGLTTTALTELRMTGSFVSPPILDFLSNLCNLKTLGITSPDSSGFETCLLCLTTLTHIGLLFEGLAKRSNHPVKMPRLPPSLLSLVAGCYNSPTDLSFLGDCTALKSLQLYHCTTLQDISELTLCPNLTELDLFCFSGVADISPLSSLRYLSSLKLPVDTADLSPLSACSSLRYLQSATLSPTLNGFQKLANASLSQVASIEPFFVGTGILANITTEFY